MAERSIGRNPMNAVLTIGKDAGNDVEKASDCCSCPRSVRRRFSSMYLKDVDAHPLHPRPLLLRSIGRAVRLR